MLELTQFSIIVKFFQEKKNLTENLLSIIMNSIRDQCLVEKNLISLSSANKNIILVCLHPIILLWEKNNSINLSQEGKNRIQVLILLIILFQERMSLISLYLVEKNTILAHLLQITQCLDHSNSTLSNLFLINQ